MNPKAAVVYQALVDRSLGMADHLSRRAVCPPLCTTLPSVVSEL
jgi:hypothetical protein